MNNIIFCPGYLTDKKRFESDEGGMIAIEDAVHALRMGRITPGMNREIVKSYNRKPLFSYRANDDIRIITCEQEKGKIFLVLVDHHDKAYFRAERVEMKINENNLLPEIKIHETKCIKYVQEKPLCRLQEIPFKKLVQLVGSETIASQLQLAKDEDDLQEKLESIVESPRVISDVIDLNAAPETIDAMLVRAVEKKERIPFEQAVKNSNDWCLLDDDVMEKFSNGTLENWQVFLHEDQSKAMKMDANGPVMITGSAGTGKTVVAVHRAKWLLENVFRNNERILFTTFTKTLADSAKAMLQTICTSDQMSRIVVKHFDEFFRDEWRVFSPDVKISYDDTYGTDFLDFLINLAIDELNLYQGSRSRDFLKEEYKNIILEHNIQTLDEYKGVVRSGLLGKVDRERERPQFWNLFKVLNNCLLNGNEFLRQHKKICNRICKSAALNQLASALKCGAFNSTAQYTAIIVDEAQDFGGPEYRFLAAMTGNTYNDPKANSLFICGDGHQRIYGRSGSLKDCGINVHSRSRCLKTCYRTTLKIREYAENLIRDVKISDMNGVDDKLLDVESIQEGETPQEKFFNGNNYKAMNEFIAEKVREWHSSGVNYSDIAVLLRNAGKTKNTEEYLFVTTRALKEYNIPASQVGKRDSSLGGDTVKVMTMHRAKGLQFHSVVIILDMWPYKGPKDADCDQKKEHINQDKCLLYMAIMRAKTNVVLTGTKGRPSNLPVLKKIEGSVFKIGEGFSAEEKKCVKDKPNAIERTIITEKKEVDVKHSEGERYFKFRKFVLEKYNHLCRTLSNYEKALEKSRKISDKPSIILNDYEINCCEKSLQNTWNEFLAGETSRCELRQSANAYILSGGEGAFQTANIVDGSRHCYPIAKDF